MLKKKIKNVQINIIFRVTGKPNYSVNTSYQSAVTLLECVMGKHHISTQSFHPVTTACHSRVTSTHFGALGEIRTWDPRTPPGIS